MSGILGAPCLSRAVGRTSPNGVTTESMTTTSILKTGRASGALLSVAVGLWAFQARCQSNLVKNGGFENGLIGWGWTYNVALFSFSDPEGGDNYVGVYGTLYQDLNTTPGQQYDVRFAMA